jgi:hypothetical protein
MSPPPMGGELVDNSHVAESLTASFTSFERMTSSPSHSACSEDVQNCACIADADRNSFYIFWVKTQAERQPTNMLEYPATSLTRSACRLTPVFSKSRPR